MEGHGQAVGLVDVAAQGSDALARCDGKELAEESPEHWCAARLGMGVEACNEPLASLSRLEHGVGDKNTPPTHDRNL